MAGWRIESAHTSQRAGVILEQPFPKNRNPLESYVHNRYDRLTDAQIDALLVED